MCFRRNSKLSRGILLMKVPVEDMVVSLASVVVLSSRLSKPSSVITQIKNIIINI